MQETRDGIYITGGHRFFPQCFFSSCYCFCHFYGIDTPAEVVGDIKDGFGRMCQHLFHLKPVRDVHPDIGGHKHRHHEIDIGKCIAQDRAFSNVFEDRASPLSCAVIDDVEAVRSRPVKTSITLHRHDRIAVPVIKDDPFGGGLKRLFHQSRWNSDEIIFGDFGPSSFQ